MEWCISKNFSGIISECSEDLDGIMRKCRGDLSGIIPKYIEGLSAMQHECRRYRGRLIRERSRHWSGRTRKCSEYKWKNSCLQWRFKWNNAWTERKFQQNDTWRKRDLCVVISKGLREMVRGWRGNLTVVISQGSRGLFGARRECRWDFVEWCVTAAEIFIFIFSFAGFIGTIW